MLKTLLDVEISKSVRCCGAKWREARLEVKMLKTHMFRPLLDVQPHHATHDDDDDDNNNNNHNHNHNHNQQQQQQPQPQPQPQQQ